MKQAKASNMRVKFLEGAEGSLSGLVVEAPANHPLHGVLSTLIADAGLSIVWRETCLSENGFQRFGLAGAKGGLVPTQARLKLQQQLMSWAIV